MKKAKNVKREKRQNKQDKNIGKRLEKDFVVKRVKVGGKYRVHIRRKTGRTQTVKVKGQKTVIQRKPKLLLNKPWTQKKNNKFYKDQFIQEPVKQEKLRYVTHIRWSYLGQYLPKGFNTPIMFNGRSAVALEGKIPFSIMKRYSFTPTKINLINRVIADIKGFKKYPKNEMLDPGTYRMSDNEGQYTIQDKLQSFKGKAKTITKKKFKPFPEHKI